MKKYSNLFESNTFHILGSSTERTTFLLQESDHVVENSIEYFIIACSPLQRQDRLHISAPYKDKTGYTFQPLTKTRQATHFSPLQRQDRLHISVPYKDKTGYTFQPLTKTRQATHFSPLQRQDRLQISIPYKDKTGYTLLQRQDRLHILVHYKDKIGYTFQSLTKIRHATHFSPLQR